MTSEYQKMIAGEVYRPSDPELRALAQASRQKQAAFNKEEDPLKGAEIIKDGLVRLGKISISIHAWWSIMESISI